MCMKRDNKITRADISRPLSYFWSVGLIANFGTGSQHEAFRNNFGQNNILGLIVYLGFIIVILYVYFTSCIYYSEEFEMF